MKMLAPALLLALCAVPAPAAPPDASTTTTAVPRPEKRPLPALPYTPSLDVRAMDKSVDPCVDLYRYSCGGWIKNNPIPPDQASWSVYAKVADENQQFLWGILEEAVQGGASRTPAQQKIGDYFGSCMDIAGIDKAGKAPLRDDFAAIASLKTVADLAPLLGRLHLGMDGSGLLFGFGSQQDAKNSAQMIAAAYAGGLGLPDRDNYLKDDAKSVETRQRYTAHVARMLELLGDAPKDAARKAQNILTLETALAKSSLSRVERRDPYRVYHRMSVGELQALTPSFPWKGYLAAEGPGSLEALNVTQPEFFKTVQAQLTAVPLADWKDYLRWHLVNARAQYLPEAFVKADFDFYRGYLRGVKEMQPRWKRCVQYVDRDLGEAMGRVFVEKTFGPEVKQSTVDMVGYIEKAMEQRIQSLPWMGEATKVQALEKLHGMKNKVGYPDNWRDYSALNVTPGDFHGNAVRGISFESKRQLAKIGRPVERGEWGMTPPTVNAYYDPQMNDMNFPAGVLLPPLFDMKMDAAPNYGNTGATIGHELTHGFDDEGRQFDATGNLRDWWTAGDAKEFEKRATCVADQYAKYTIVDDIKINSRLTLGEDVADVGGTIIAYLAWKEATKGLDLKAADGLSPEQRFFVGFGQWACGDERAESKRVRALTNPHSPPEHRINGVVVNMPEFREAFSCKAGQPMTREEVCRIW